MRSLNALADPTRQRIVEMLAAGGNALDAAARMVVYVAKSHHRVDGRCFDALQRLLASEPTVSLAQFKEALREQWAILAIDERAAIESLPQLLPADAGDSTSELRLFVPASSPSSTAISSSKPNTLIANAFSWNERPDRPRPQQ